VTLKRTENLIARTKSNFKGNLDLRIWCSVSKPNLILLSKFPKEVKNRGNPELAL
jgi:hypothetical protein